MIMYDYPIEQEESTDSCIVCGVPVAGEDFCSLECIQVYAEATGEHVRPPLSPAEVRRIEQILVLSIENQTFSPEGVELDISMERKKDNLNNRDWAARQARLFKIDLRG